MKNTKIMSLQSDAEYTHRFLSLTQEWYWELDDKGRIVRCSPQVEELLSYRADEVIGRKLISLMSQSNETQQDAAVFAQQRIRHNDPIVNLVCGFYDKQQQAHYLELTAEPIFQNGSYSGYHGIARELPEHAKLEKTLHNLADGFSAKTGKAFFRSLVTHLAKLFQVDYALVGEFTGENRDMVRVLVVHARGEITEDFQYPVSGTPCEEVFDGKLSCYSRNVQQAFPDDPMLPDMDADSYLGAPLYTSDGKINGIMAVIHSKPFAHLGYIQSIFRLYVARAAAELERQQMLLNLERMAHQDDLTGLCNRNLFLSLLEQAISRARRNKELVGLMFLDLDHFKDINDSLGHEAGDKVLTLIAQRLQQTVREEDTVARIGGDEFVVLLGEVRNLADTQKVAKKIVERLKKPIEVDLHELHVTTSIGISMHPMDGNDASTLMKNADIALYRAKSLGRNTYQLYSEEMGLALEQKLNTESDLRNAIANKEFELFYQPKMDLASKKVYGSEALLRWNHPDKGIILPGSFITLLEETGAIVAVGSWVLETALMEMQACVAQYQRPLNLSVNISAKQLREAGFLEKLETCLEKSGFDPNYLELEITESILIEEGEHITELLRKIKDKGVRLSLDDFGTGYSSLIYLRRFPIDSIKIDKSFVDDINDNEDDMVVVKALIEMAQALQLGVVAEGVETAEQLNALEKIGCNQIQGYFYSKPIPYLEFEHRYRNL